MRIGEEISVVNEERQKRRETVLVCFTERERAHRGEAWQILSRGEIALLRIYCFKCNWVQPAPGEKIHRGLLSSAA